MENKLYRLVFLTVVFFFAIGMQAQRRNARYVEYINKYSELAVEQMKLHKIPASITLAQGLLESGAGYSQLARKSNNHFGIKCGGSWRGRSVRHDDDARNECFRAYKRVILTKTIPIFFEEEPVMPSFSNSILPIIKDGRAD